MHALGVANVSDATAVFFGIFSIGIVLVFPVWIYYFYNKMKENWNIRAFKLKFSAPLDGHNLTRTEIIVETTVKENLLDSEEEESFDPELE